MPGSRRRSLVSTVLLCGAAILGYAGVSECIGPPHYRVVQHLYQDGETYEVHQIGNLGLYDTYLEYTAHDGLCTLHVASVDDEGWSAKDCTLKVDENKRTLTLFHHEKYVGTLDLKTRAYAKLEAALR